MADTTAKAPADLLIYGSPVSPFVRKIAAMLHEKEVGYDIEPVNIMSPPNWFGDISPMKRIPVLRDRTVGTEGAAGTIADSSAIAGFIEKKHPAPALYPQEAFDYGRALFIEEFADTTLVAATGMGVFRPIFFALMQGKEPDIETARTAWRDAISPALDYLESALEEAGGETSDGPRYFVGNAFSIADIAVTTSLHQASLVAHIPLDRWPRFKAHQANMEARASITQPYATADRFVRKALPERFDLT